jgi:hypothetical protein
MILKIEFSEKWDLQFVEWFSGNSVPKNRSSNGFNWWVWLIIPGKSPFVWIGSSSIFNKLSWKEK